MSQETTRPISCQQTAATLVLLLIQSCIISSRLVYCTGAWIVPESETDDDNNNIVDQTYSNNYYGNSDQHEKLWYNLARAQHKQNNPYINNVNNYDNNINPETFSNPYLSNVNDEQQQDLPDLQSFVLEKTNQIRANEANEIYLLEDKDYPTDLYENYNGVGQVSGIAALPSDDIAIFHRAERIWDENTFDSNNVVKTSDGSQPEDNLIKNNTIVILDSNNGSAVTSFGSNLFYMPHGIASDSLGNLWVSDVARHQVMRLPTGRSPTTAATTSSGTSLAASTSNFNFDQYNSVMKKKKKNKSYDRNDKTNLPVHQLWPDIIIGEAFVPGNDSQHFCQPSEIAVSSNGQMVYIADGYCNRRVMVFTGSGKYLTSFGEDVGLSVVHSLTLLEEQNLLFVADRENGRVLAFKAGLDNDLASMGQLVSSIDYPIGRVFAITTLGSNHLLVSSNQIGSNRFDLAALNPFRRELKFIWTSTDLVVPHSLTHTKDNHYAYAADISKDAHKKVFKFDVIQRTL